MLLLLTWLLLLLNFVSCQPVQSLMNWAPTQTRHLQAELDRFCNAMIAIREEIKEIEDGKVEK